MRKSTPQVKTARKVEKAVVRVYKAAPTDAHFRDAVRAGAAVRRAKGAQG